MPKKQRKDITASLRHEREYLRYGYERIIGVDEAGRGPWAGPVAAAVVALPLKRADLTQVLKGVRDSKQMTPIQRAEVVATIKDVALVWGIGHASAQEIGQLLLIKATKLAMQRAYDAAVQDNDFEPQCIFTDYIPWPEMSHIPQLSIVGGDQYSLSIAAASVLAKEWRDAYMLELDTQYPQYGFAQHKGYGTAAHRAAIAHHGPSEVHRMNYRPIQNLMKAKE